MILDLYLLECRPGDDGSRRNSAVPAPSGRSRARIGQGLLRTALAHQTDTDPRDWEIGKRFTGRPYIQRSPGPQFAISLSHSGGFFAAAVTDAASLGVDIERIRPRRYRQIAQHLGWPDAAWNIPGQPKADEFFHGWTIWEAAIKSRVEPPGELFTAVLDSVVLGRPGSANCGSWFIHSLVCHGLFWISAMAAHDQVPPVRIFLVDVLDPGNLACSVSQVSIADGILDPVFAIDSMARAVS